ncbi:hypothetical protein CDO46_14915 [Pigmentiphaga sp. NML030171]|uniref:Uncharacterized protein n=2 Tax=Alcaligenaceae TaxID=506 RepID=A0ABN1BJF4_9BURK|nr:hypothetical protein CDO46_14915 [Pigmentiphaga sp. NML030171]
MFSIYEEHAMKHTDYAARPPHGGGFSSLGRTGMKHFALAIGLAGCCAVAYAQQAPTRDQATQALQNAMQREIQSMNNQQGFDSPSATSMTRSLEVKALNNCSASGSQSVTCDVTTSADVKGNRREGTHRYEFYQQGGRWEARLPAS